MLPAVRSLRKFKPANENSDKNWGLTEVHDWLTVGNAEQWINRRKGNPEHDFYVAVY